MLLNKMKKGESGEITNILADKALKDRFNSLGICKGEQVSIKEISLAKQSIEIDINGALLVLRSGEAEKIEVKMGVKQWEE